MVSASVKAPPVSFSVYSPSGSLLKIASVLPEVHVMESAVLLPTVIFLLFSTVTSSSVAPLSSGLVSVRISVAPVTSCFPVMSLLPMVSLEVSSSITILLSSLVSPFTFPTLPSAPTSKFISSVFLVKPSGAVVSSSVYTPAGRFSSITPPLALSEVHVMVLPLVSIPAVLPSL